MSRDLQSPMPRLMRQPMSSPLPVFGWVPDELGSLLSQAKHGNEIHTWLKLAPHIWPHHISSSLCMRFLSASNKVALLARLICTDHSILLESISHDCPVSGGF